MSIIGNFLEQCSKAYIIGKKLRIISQDLACMHGYRDEISPAFPKPEKADRRSPINHQP